MSKQEREYKVPQTEVASLKAVFASVIMAACFAFDLFAMINLSDMIWLIAIISLVFLASVYFFVSSIVEIRFLHAKRMEETYNDLFKSSKATYLMLKKYGEDLEERLDELEDRIGIPTEEIIDAQKSIAKITISRNKENADALMNSNDKVIDKLYAFEEAIERMEEKLLSSQKESSKEGMRDILLKQTEITNAIKQLELSLGKDIYSIGRNMQAQPVMMAAPMQAPQMPGESAFTAFDEKAEEDFNDLLGNSEDADINIDSLLGEDDNIEPSFDLPSMDDIPADDEFAGEVPTGDSELGDIGIDIGNEFSETADLGLDIGAEFAEEPVMEDIPVEEPVVEPEPEMIPEPEPIPKPEPAAEIPPMPDLSDPNHVMTPDEIQALLANQAATPVPEPEPEPEPAPATEDKPPMPDLSDPNHVMTPDEIQALLANMG